MHWRPGRIAAPAANLLELAGDNVDPALHTLAMRGAVQVAAQEPDLDKRVALLQRAMTVAKRVEERRQALGQLGQIQTLPALDAVLPYLADPGVVNEAAAAAVGIAEKLVDSHPQAVEEAAAKILAHCQTAEIVRRASALRGKPKSGPFLRDWLVCGPYSQPDVTGAVNLFDIAFGPEKSDENVQWRPAPSGDAVNLSGIFSRQVQLCGVPEDPHYFAAGLRRRTLARQRRRRESVAERQRGSQQQHRSRCRARPGPSPDQTQEGSEPAVAQGHTGWRRLVGLRPRGRR